MHGLILDVEYFYLHSSDEEMEAGKRHQGSTVCQTEVLPTCNFSAQGSPRPDSVGRSCSSNGEPCGMDAPGGMGRPLWDAPGGMRRPQAGLRCPTLKHPEALMTESSLCLKNSEPRLSQAAESFSEGQELLQPNPSPEPH